MRLRRPVTAGALLIAIAAIALTLLARLPAAGNASDVPPALPASDGPLIVYREFGLAADALYAADPDDPDGRVELALVAHAWGYGTFPSLSPDGDHIATTAVPPQGGPAQLQLLTIATGEATLLAENVDLTAPVWAPDGTALVVRRSAPHGTNAELVRVDLDGEATTIVAASAGLYPIEVSPDGGWLYYASLTPAGTEAARVSLAGGTPESLGRLSAGVARDWDLSPDGSRLAYLAQTDGPTTFVAEVRDLATGAASRPIAGLQFAPVWRNNVALTVGRLDAGPATAAAQVSLAGEAAAAPALPAPDAGFDVPVSWSPDGELLIVRNFLGTSAADPGPSFLVVVRPGGSRTPVSTSSDVAVAGWLEVTP